jgi:hypothetical protein
MPHDATPVRSEQAHPLATQVRQRLLSFLAPLLRTLDQHLDRRLVVTFVETLQALLIWRHRFLGLLLSELGSYLAEPGHAPAGTKRLSNLLRSSIARPLTRIRKGFSQPPIGRRPICVAGLHWIGLLVSGLASTPSVALMQWWTHTRCPYHRPEGRGWSVTGALSAAMR